MRTRANRWRGTANGAPPRARRRPGRGKLRLEGTVRWVEREQRMIHVALTGGAPGVGAETGEVVGLDVSRARTRYVMADRDGDRRIDISDIALGDRVQATVAPRAALAGGVIRVSRALVSPAEG